MTLRPILAVVLATGLAVAPLSAPAQLYRWVDAGGTVNYGDAPPPGARGVRAVGADSGSLSVVPGIAPEERERLRQRDEQRRLERLEREVEELRARELARASAPPEVVVTEVFVPVWGGNRVRPPHRRPPGSGPGRPEHPIAKPRPPERTQPVLDMPVVQGPREAPRTLVRR